MPRAFLDSEESLALHRNEDNEAVRIPVLFNFDRLKKTSPPARGELHDPRLLADANVAPWAVEPLGEGVPRVFLPGWVRTDTRYGSPELLSRLSERLAEPF